MSGRGVAPVVGISLLVAVTVMLAAVVGAFAIGVGGIGSGRADDVPQAAISAKVSNAHPNQINLTHEGGDTLDVRDITIRIFVDGEPLEHQPDVPFFSQTGFQPGPTGPFNSATADKNWTTGEGASLTVAGTNSPRPSDGSQVTVKIYSDGKAVTAARV